MGTTDSTVLNAWRVMICARSACAMEKVLNMLRIPVLATLL